MRATVTAKRHEMGEGKGEVGEEGRRGRVRWVRREGGKGG
jgi:hypothetical protein